MPLFKKIILSTLLASSVLTSHVATAKTPTDSSLVQLAKVSSLDTAVQDGIKSGFMQAMTQAILNSPEIQALDSDKQARAKVLVADFTNDIFAKLDMTSVAKQIASDFIVVAKKHYTQKEVDAMIKFYSSPEGKSIIDKQMVVMNELMEYSLTKVMQDEALEVQLQNAIADNISTLQEKLATLHDKNPAK